MTPPAVKLKQDYLALFSELDDRDKADFKNLEALLASHFNDEYDKWEVLYEMTIKLHKSQNKSFRDLYGDDPESHALKINRSVQKQGVHYWRTTLMLNVYFIFFYLLLSLLIGEFVLSFTFLVIPALTFIMVPLINRGIMDRPYKEHSYKNFSTLIFLSIFVLAKAIMILALNRVFDVTTSVGVDTSLFNVLTGMFFALLTVSALLLIIYDRDWYNRILFIAIGLYTFAWVCDRFGILEPFADFMLTYGMFILLPMVIFTQYLKSKNKNP